MRKHWRTWVIGVIAALVLLGPLAWVIGEARALYTTSDNNAEKAAALSALAAVGGLVATLLLLAVTGWYAVLTRGILRQAGPIVSIVLRAGWIQPSSPFGGPTAGLYTTPLDELHKGTPDPQFPVPVLAVSLNNSGNAATSIRSISIKGSAGVTWRPLSFVLGADCPFPLPPHDAESRCVDLLDVLAALDSYAHVKGKKSPKICAIVMLGSGREVKSRWEKLPADVVAQQGAPQPASQQP